MGRGRAVGGPPWLTLTDVKGSEKEVEDLLNVVKYKIKKRVMKKKRTLKRAPNHPCVSFECCWG
jgi:hypothetical protein